MKVRELLDTRSPSTYVKVEKRGDDGVMKLLYDGSTNYFGEHRSRILWQGEDKQDYSFLDLDVDQWFNDEDDHFQFVVFCK